MRRWLVICLSFVALSAHGASEALLLSSDALRDKATVAESMSELARQALAHYAEPDRNQFLNTRFRLQLAADQYAEALASLDALMALRAETSPESAAPLLPFALFAKAKLKQLGGELSLVDAYSAAFRDEMGRMDDRQADAALFWFGGDIDRMRADLDTALDAARGKTQIPLVEALDLIRKFQFNQTFQLAIPLGNTLIPEDDARRYVADLDVLVETPEGAKIAAMVVRPRSVKKPLPTLLNFTIYAGDESAYRLARSAAAHGYAGVVAYSRGKGRSPDLPAPYEHEVDDVHAVIDWISKQSWSDHRVGMYGGSYDGFSQWAATKRGHPALKTIVPYVAAIPGQGLPMENNVFLNANYGWAFYVTNNKYLDDATYNDQARWQALPDNWYTSGKSYRQIDGVDGTPNPWLQRWLQHPAYDAYWRAMVPFGAEFSRINLPVLTITGYYDDGQISALRYVKDHYRYNKSADHYLLIGPYDHFGAQNARKAVVLRDYPIDPVAQIDTPKIMFEWMDHIFHGGARPELLKDQINYQVMGGNVWKHAKSLDQMSNRTLTLYLTNTPEDDKHRLSRKRPPKPGALTQTVDFADRTTSNNGDYYPWPIVGSKPDMSNGQVFISEPFDKPMEVSGTFSGEIQATINKQGMDIGLVLYEVMPNGDLFHLSYFLGRASYAKDPSRRHLLKPGKRESIPFSETRLVSRQLSKGSRLLVMLNVNRNSGAQVNHGSGKDVSDEDIRDARDPLEIQWHNRSFVRIPVWE